MGKLEIDRIGERVSINTIENSNRRFQIPLYDFADKVGIC